MEELLLQLTGKSKPAVHNCIIAVDECGAGVLLKSEPSLYEHDLFDGLFLEDNLTNKKEIPKDAGVYRCQIEVQSFRCNHPEDPEEWDMTVVLKNVEKLQIEGL